MCKHTVVFRKLHSGTNDPSKIEGAFLAMLFGLSETCPYRLKPYR